MEYTVVNGFSAMIEYFALYSFLWMFFDKNPERRRWRLICHIIMPVLFFLFSSFVSTVYLRPALFVVCSWFIAQGFRGDLWLRIFSVSVFQIILVLLEIIISLTLQPIEGLSMESFYLSGNIFIRLITIGILITLFFVSQKRRYVFLHLSVKSVLILLLFSAMSFFFVLFSEYLLLLLDSPSLYLIGCVEILLCLFSNILLYYLFSQLSIGEDAKARLALVNMHLVQQKEEQCYRDQTYHEIRKLSHDMNRYLSAIYSLLQQGKIEDAMIELKKHQLEVFENQAFDTGYPVINSVLAYKVQLAQKQNIQLQIFWNLKDSLHMNLIDLAVILSNSLDNAIEAASNVTNKKPFVSLTAKTKGNYVLLEICNNTATAPNIVDGKIATTKQNKQFHGFGLESIQRLAQQYDGESFLDYQDGFFTLSVILNNRVMMDEK